MGRAWPQPGDPLWLDEDRQWLYALMHVEADVCGDCGQPWGEVSDSKNEYAYDVTLPRCHACAAIARTVRKHQDGHGSMDGLRVQITKSEPSKRR